MSGGRGFAEVGEGDLSWWCKSILQRCVVVRGCLKCMPFNLMFSAHCVNYNVKSRPPVICVLVKRVVTG